MVFSARPRSLRIVELAEYLVVRSDRRQCRWCDGAGVAQHRQQPLQRRPVTRLDILAASSTPALSRDHDSVVGKTVCSDSGATTRAVERDLPLAGIGAAAASLVTSAGFVVRRFLDVRVGVAFVSGSAACGIAGALASVSGVDLRPNPNALATDDRRSE